MKPRTLLLLIDLEERRFEKAQLAYSQLQQAHQQAREQTRQLEAYRSDYRGRSPLVSSGPTDIAHLVHHGKFVDRLTEAITAQQDREVELSTHLQSAQAELATRFQRVQGLRKLQAIEQQRSARLIAKIEQRDSDERASRNHFLSSQALT